MSTWSYLHKTFGSRRGCMFNKFVNFRDKLRLGVTKNNRHQFLIRPLSSKNTHIFFCGSDILPPVLSEVGISYHPVHVGTRSNQSTYLQISGYYWVGRCTTIHSSVKPFLAYSLWQAMKACNPPRHLHAPTRPSYRSRGGRLIRQTMRSVSNSISRAIHAASLFSF